jgi:N-hydroxyarylamine O-acetyltransferase
VSRLNAFIVFWHDSVCCRLLFLVKTPVNLNNYLRRVGFEAFPRADLPTLRALHRAHVQSVPFENLDVQLHRLVTLDTQEIYEKVVERRRGGWCYELNGLMGWALQEIGFDVMRMTAGVMRESLGNQQLGNHLCLLVRLERPYLVDVGFGSSLVEPLALERGDRADAPYRVALAQVDEAYWRFTEQEQGASFSFDFEPVPADESLLAAKCQYQQSAAASPFVQNLVAKRRVADAHLTLRGRVLTRTGPVGTEKTVINSAHELLACLREHFHLDVPEIASVWPVICARHEALFNSKAP